MLQLTCNTLWTSSPQICGPQCTSVEKGNAVSQILHEGYLLHAECMCHQSQYLLVLQVSLYNSA